MVRIQEHYRTRQPNPAIIPDATWWVFLFAANALAEDASIAFTKLQGSRTLLTQQRATLNALADTYISVTGISGPMQPDYISRLSAIERSSVSKSGGYMLHHAAAEAYLVELDTSTEAAISTLAPEENPSWYLLWQ
jgi:hypothetical protein